MAQTRNVSIYGAAIAVEETLVSLSAQLESAGAAEAAVVYAGLAKDVGQCAQVVDAFVFVKWVGWRGGMWFVSLVKGKRAVVARPTNSANALDAAGRSTYCRNS